MTQWKGKKAEPGEKDAWDKTAKGIYGTFDEPFPYLSTGVPHFSPVLREAGTPMVARRGRRGEFDRGFLMKNFKALLFVAVVVAGTAVWAASPERYLHIKVNNPKTEELVRVNVPLSLAEKVIPAINHGNLQNGKVHVGHFEANDVDVRAILEAVKSAPEGEFVSVQKPGEEVRVAKEHGQLVAHVKDKGGKERVDVTIPWEVAQALISETTDNQLNISAAIKALQNIGDMTLVTVSGDEESVRIWIDSNNTDGK